MTGSSFIFVTCESFMCNVILESYVVEYFCRFYRRRMHFGWLLVYLLLSDNQSIYLTWYWCNLQMLWNALREVSFISLHLRSMSHCWIKTRHIIYDLWWFVLYRITVVIPAFSFSVSCQWKKHFTSKIGQIMKFLHFLPNYKSNFNWT